MKKPVEGSVQAKIINALSLGDRSTASRLLLDVSCKDDVLRADDFLYILRYCKSSPDPLFVMETWKTMQLKEVGITIRCYLLIIGALCKGGYIEEFAVLQKKLSAAHDIWKECCKYCNPSITILKQFIWSFAKLQDYTVLQHMLACLLHGDSSVDTDAKGSLYTRRLDIPIPYYNLSNLETGSADNENSVPSLVEHFNNVGTPAILQILRSSFNDVIYARAQAKNIALAEHTILQLKLMLNRNVRPCDSTYATISIAFSCELQLDLAEYFLYHVSNCPVTHPYNYCLEACNILDQPERAIRILAKMIDKKLRADISTYELMFSLFSYVNAPYESGNKLSRVDAATRISAIEADMLKSGIQQFFVN